MVGHTEIDFERAIENGLITRDRYQQRAAFDFDVTSALFPEDVIGFVRDSQPARWGQLEAMLKDRTVATVLDSLMKELAVWSRSVVVRVLPHGGTRSGTGSPRPRHDD